MIESHDRLAVGYGFDIASSNRNAIGLSASVVVPIVMKLFNPSSVVDFGCGPGDWLSEFHRHGVPKISGYDGDWALRANLRIDPEIFHAVDLNYLAPLAERYDLAISLEVAEHLTSKGGERLVQALTLCSDIVVFSAAIPQQGGYMHINEQYQSYWVQRFAERNFFAFDLIRPKIWCDERVCWWYRQNLLVFATMDAAKRLGMRLEPVMSDVVHPFLYDRIRDPGTWSGRKMIFALLEKLRRKMFASANS
jgi:hypothetical protein